MDFRTNEVGCRGVPITDMHAFYKTPEEGAETAVCLASLPEVEGVSWKW
ncbi:MAG: hypothetical protein KAW84_05000 [Thermoplasmata archaeon]|nr:hypothetical protein [Thermoplasmata archaeon]